MLWPTSKVLTGFFLRYTNKQAKRPLTGKSNATDLFLKLNQMKQIFALAIAVSFFGLLTSAHGQDPLKLPTSETAAVFEMEFSGGFRRPDPAGWVKKPYLQVFADGRVVNNPNSPQLQAYEFKLKPEQLRNFLKQVVIDNKFYEIDTDKIKQEMAATGQRVLIADAPSLSISMELAQGSHQTRVYALSSVAKQHPKIKGLQQLEKIQRLGRQLVYTATAGGYDQVEKALKKVNQQLKEKGLDLMTLDELYTCRQKDGVLTINFNRKYYQPNGRWRDWINAKFTAKGDEEDVEIKTNIDKDKTMTKPVEKAAAPSKS